jgi:hypothetical protein
MAPHLPPPTLKNLMATHIDNSRATSRSSKVLMAFLTKHSVAPSSESERQLQLQSLPQCTSKYSIEKSEQCQSEAGRKPFRPSLLARKTECIGEKKSAAACYPKAMVQRPLPALTVASGKENVVSPNGYTNRIMAPHLTPPTLKNLMATHIDRVRKNRAIRGALRPSGEIVGKFSTAVVQY